MNGVGKLMLAGAMLAGSAGSALAASQLDLYSPQPASYWSNPLSEIRVGINAHAAAWTFLPTTPPWQYDMTHINDVSFDALFKAPDWDWYKWIGSPRPNLGGTLNLAGKESMVHAALTWHAQIFDTPLYAEGTFGAALNDGYTTNAPPGFRNMGCNFQFYEVFGLGTNLGEHATATLTYEHTSNANLCAANQGLSNFGIRLGYRF
jgi:opacity protein-like surface antigen